MFNFTLSVQELRAPHATHVLNVRWFTSIRDIKDMLHRITGQSPRNLDLFYGTSASRLSNNMTLHDFGIEKDGYVLRLIINNGGNASCRLQSFVLTPSRDVELSDDCERMLTEVSTGLKNGAVPMRTDVLDCTGGVYFMRDSAGRKIAVFKPHDEEQGMPNNGKGYDGNGETSLRANFKPGQGCIREVAAYIMDVGDFTGVPPTTLVHCEHNAFLYPSHAGKVTQPFPKLGSLQRFVLSDGTFEDVGSSLISDFEVQKIALFDLRLLNCDRNASNILVSKKRRKFDSPPLRGSSDNKHRRGNRSCSVSSWESNGTQYSSSDDWMDEGRGSEDFGRNSFLNSGITTRSNSEPHAQASLGSGRLSSALTSSEASTWTSPSAGPSATSSPRFESVPDQEDDTVAVGESGKFGEREGDKRSDRDRYTLIPIDHGYSLPTRLDIKEWDWVWFNLPHVKRPVHPKIREYILALDFEDLVQQLTSQVSISEDSLFLLRIAHNLLVNGIKAGLTLHQIASLIARVDDDGEVPSPVERAIAMAEENAHRAIEMRSSRVSHGKGIRATPRAPPTSPMHRTAGQNDHSVDDGIGLLQTPSNLLSANNAVGAGLYGPEQNKQFPECMDLKAMARVGNRGAGGGLVSQRSYQSTSALAAGMPNETSAAGSTKKDRTNCSTRSSSGTDLSANFAIGLMDVDVDTTGYGSEDLRREDDDASALSPDLGSRFGLTVSDTDDKESVELSPKAFTSTESSPRAFCASDFESMRGAMLGPTAAVQPLGAAYGMSLMDGAPRATLMRLNSLNENALNSEPLIAETRPAKALSHSSNARGLVSAYPAIGGGAAPGGALVRQTALQDVSTSSHFKPAPISIEVSEDRVLSGEKKSPNALYRLGAERMNGAADGSIKSHSNSGDNLYLTALSTSILPSHQQANRGSAICVSGIASPERDLSGVSKGSEGPISRASLLSAKSPLYMQQTLARSTSSAGKAATPPAALPGRYHANGSKASWLYGRAAAVTTAENVANQLRTADIASVDTDSEASSPNEDSPGDTNRVLFPANEPPPAALPVSLKRGDVIPGIDALDNDDPPELSGAPLMRVTSFTAFSNPPLYDVETSERRFGKLSREKRRQQVSTSEFRALRHHFTQDRLLSIIGQLA